MPWLLAPLLLAFLDVPRAIARSTHAAAVFRWSCENPAPAIGYQVRTNQLRPNTETCAHTQSPAHDATPRK